MPMQTRAIIPLLLAGLFLSLTACSGPGTSTAQQSTSAKGTPSTIGSFREYALPQPQSGVMRPTVDHQGRIWFGEMAKNALVVFDPRTHTFQQMTPPHGDYGIMGIAVAADDSIWFAEQYANYIGHYFPASKQFKIYMLPTLTTPDPSNQKNILTLPSGPNDIAIDAHGNVWFTEMNANFLGMLDKTTGHIQQYPLSAQKTVQTLNPYGISIDLQGIIWFTEASTNNLGRLDPRTGSIQIFKAPGASNPLMEVISDSHGTIWTTTFDNSSLLKFDPTRAVFTAYVAPATPNGSRAMSSGLYGLTLTSDGNIWVTVTAENFIACFNVVTDHFTYYQVPTENSLPLGIVAGTDHTLWFTESASNKLGMLQF